MKSTLFALSFIVTTSFSSILGGLHDLSGGLATTEEELCIYCHTPELAPDGTATFPLYGQESNASTQFVDATLSCLGCHDGVTATYQAINPIENKVYLDRMHPVAITYNEDKRSLRSKYTIINNWQNATVINDLLVDGQLQCVTCHNPHSNDNGRFLRHNNKYSDLCTSCHEMGNGLTFP